MIIQKQKESAWIISEVVTPRIADSYGQLRFDKKERARVLPDYLCEYVEHSLQH